MALYCDRKIFSVVALCAKPSYILQAKCTIDAQHFYKEYNYS